MRMKLREFRAWKNKALTFMGMSGVGKTTLASKLPKSTWFLYSGDYRIGTKYLSEPILDNIKKQAMQIPFLRELLRSDSIYIANNITVDNLAPLSTFVGKLGDPRLGGLGLQEFKRRQSLHRRAEICAMREIGEFIVKAKEIYGYSKFVNDAGGSVCELNDEKTIAHLGEHTLVVYIQADQSLEQSLIERQIDYPKPMYYQQEFLDSQLDVYLQEQALTGSEEINPDAFVRWIFPRLLAHRRPLYESIAQRFGCTVEARAIESVRDEADVLALVEGAL
ncbi:MAG: ATPase [Gammaproteobacteria bacterium]|nr:ATPase [Gammaproteobacteria bacterium]